MSDVRSARPPDLWPAGRHEAARSRRTNRPFTSFVRTQRPRAAAWNNAHDTVPGSPAPPAPQGRRPTRRRPVPSPRLKEPRALAAPRLLELPDTLDMPAAAPLAESFAKLVG